MQAGVYQCITIHSTMLGPILILKLKASICPCLTSEQDSVAINAIQSLSNVPIIYQSTTSGSVSTGVGKLVGLFKKKSAATSTTQTGHMSITDTMRGPALSIQCEAENDKAPGETKIFSLKSMGEITSNDSFMSSSSSSISIFRRKKHGNDEQSEICRIDLKDASGDDVGSEERDEIIDSLKKILQWDMDRRANQPDDPDEEEDEEDTPRRAGIGQRALKMKHFASREIELTKQKRDRESRKARYLLESGGLKYTAVAMANREMT